MNGNSEESAVSTATMSLTSTYRLHLQRRSPLSFGMSDLSRQPSVQYSKAMKFIETYLGNEYCVPQQGEAMIRTPRTIVILNTAFQFQNMYARPRNISF